MKALTLPLLALAIIFGLVLAQPIAQRWENDNQHAQALQLLDEQRQAYALQQWQTEQAATLPAKIAGQYGLLILLLVGAGGIFYIVYDGYKQRRTPLTRFDPEHPLVARWMLEQGNADLILAMMRQLELSGQAQIARANASGNVPHNYAPHISVSTPKSTAPAELPYVDAPAPELPAERQPLALLPGECTLAALQRSGIIARSGNSLHVGSAVADGTPIYLELSTWGALALGGKSRTGKTSRAVYFLAQAALCGWKIVICDKHGAGKQDALLAKVGMLENSFLLPAAVNQADHNRRIQQVYSIGLRRLNNQDTSRYPIVLCVDEMTALILTDWLEDKTLDQMMAIGAEMAGVNIHLLAIGHDWSAACLGKERGAAFRRVTTHRIAHRLDAQGAQFLLPSGMGKRAESLTLGQALFVDESGEPILCDCPLLTEEDLRYAAEHSGRYIGTHQGAHPSAAIDDAAPALHQPHTSPAPALTPASVAHQDAPNPKAARVRELLLQQRTQTEIVSEVWHLEPRERGAAYKEAMDEYRAIVAELLGGA